MKKKVGIGIIGLGTIGTGVIRAIRERKTLLAERTGYDFEIAAACDRDPEKLRQAGLPEKTLTPRYQDVIDHPGVEIVVELIGGLEPAGAIITGAFARGKSVVTANKALLAEQGAALFAAAADHACHLGFEAAVCGAIPVIRSIREGFIADRITALYGILNGTTNFILTRMAEDGLGLAEALAVAQAKGYAEREPDLDLSGRDSAHKISILAALVTGRFFPASALPTEGITGITPEDLRYAAELGYAVKLLSALKSAPPGPGDGTREKRARFSIATFPALVPARHMLSSVREVYNAVYLVGDLTGENLFFGKGAGMNPTAGSVLSDLATIGRAIIHGIKPRSLRLKTPDPGRAAPADGVSRFYFRFNALDRPGVFARIADVLGRHDIGIASCIQKEENPKESVPVVITTHRAGEGQVRRALTEISRLPVITGRPVSLRIVLED